jgi:hypothetical protein
MKVPRGAKSGGVIYTACTACTLHPRNDAVWRLGRVQHCFPATRRERPGLEGAQEWGGPAENKGHDLGSNRGKQQRCTPD